MAGTPHMSNGLVRGGGSRVLLGGGLVCLAGFLVLTAIVLYQNFDGADKVARALVRQSHHPLLQSFMEGASVLGGHPGQAAVILLGSTLLWRRQRRWAVSLPVVMAGAGILQFVAKWAVDRPRPNLDSWGFPSAHVLTLVVLFGFIAYLVGASGAGRPWRTLGVGACAATVGTVAFSRMYLDAHWLSDVLGGMSGGLAYLLVAIWLIRWVPDLGAAPLADLAPGPVVATAGGIATPGIAAP